MPLLKIALSQCFDPPHDWVDYNEEKEFPPPIIEKWLQRQTVNADDLVAELEYWTIKMAGGNPKWLRCTKCELVTRADLLAAHPEAFE